MRAPRLITLTVCALSLVVAAGGLVGCTKSAPKAAASPSGSSTSSVNPSAADSGLPATQNSLPDPSSIVNNLDKRKSIVLTKCAAVDGGWAASGTAKNTGKTDVKYNITIFFTNEHATVEDFATASVTVPAGASGDWSAAKKFTASKLTNCVLRGVG